MEERTTAATEQAAAAEAPQPQTAAAPTPEAPAPLSIGLREDGGLEFGEGFLNGTGPTEPEGGETPAQPEAAPQTEAPQQEAAQAEAAPQPEAAQQAPQFYTPDELRAVSWDAVDLNRLPEAARPYFPMVRDMAQQNAALAAQIQAMQIAQSQQRMQPQAAAPQQQTQGQALDFRALSTAARERAKQILGLGANDDLDLYEMDHSAAMMAAMGQILTEQRERQAQAAQAEAANAQARQAFGNFVSELAARPDYQEFDQFFTQALARVGKTPSDVGNDFISYYQRTGDLRGIQDAMTRYYQDFQAQKARAAQAAAGVKVAPKPPVLESAGGGAVEGRRGLNLDAFREMDPREQGDALAKLFF